MKSLAFPFKERVARLVIHDGMEPFIFTVVAVSVLCVDRALAIDVRLLEVCQRLIRDAIGGKSRADGFELRHDFEHFDKLDRSRLTDKHAASGDLLDKTRQGEALQSFAERRTRHIELFGKLHFVQPLAVRESAFENHSLQLVSDCVRSFLAHAFAYRVSSKKTMASTLYTKFLT